jgi:predicted chitinase
LKRDFVKWLNKIGMPKYITNDELKDVLMNDLKFLSKMDAKEYTLYKKYKEIERNYKAKPVSNMNMYFDTGDTRQLEDSGVITVKNDIWVPKSPDDYLDLEPNIIYTEKKPLHSMKWTYLRVFTHTQANNANIGRDLRFIVNDGKTGKHLGIICLSSDFMDLTGRDNYIGWSREVKTANAMINHTAIGSTICPTQPLGFNFLGGKLLALLTLSKPMEEAWESVYKCKLAGLTTTSLYGSYSQYSNLKYWIHKTGKGKNKVTFKTRGSIRFEPERETIRIAWEWLKYHYPLRYFEWYAALKETGLPLKRDHKQRSLTFIYKKLGIEDKYTEAKHARGVFFCPLYTNTKEFLRMELTDETRRFDNSIEALTQIWKDKYASKRVKKLVADGRYNTDMLFYEGMAFVNSWEEAKEIYLGDVGR